MLQWLNEYGGLLACLGFILSIPLAVAANLLTPRAQDWFARRSKAKAQKRILALQKELKEAAVLHEDPVRLLACMILAGLLSLVPLFLALLTASVVVLAFVSAIFHKLYGTALTPIIDLPVEFLSSLRVATDLMTMGLFFLSIYFIAFLIRHSYAALNFENYKSRVEERISRLEQQAGGGP
jgi:hypothetical protein